MSGATCTCIMKKSSLQKNRTNLGHTCNPLVYKSFRNQLKTLARRCLNITFLIRRRLKSHKYRSMMKEQQITPPNSIPTKIARSRRVFAFQSAMKGRPGTRAARTWSARHLSAPGGI